MTDKSTTARAVRGGSAATVAAGRAPAGREPARVRSERRRRGVTERQRPLWLLTPGGVLMTLIIIIPLLLAFYISLTDLDQYTLRRWLDAPFIGLKNFVEAFQSGLPRSIWISVSFAVISTVATVPLGMAAAIATQNRYRGRGLVRAVFLIPYVLPSFVVATVWRTMLQRVDGEVHEASAVDGANWWPKLLHVILPYLRGPVLLACLLATLNHINNFTLPFVLFGAPAPNDVNVMPMIVYVTSFQSLRFGLSAAMAIVSLLLIAIPLFIYLRALRLDVHEEGGR